MSPRKIVKEMNANSISFPTTDVLHEDPRGNYIRGLRKSGLAEISDMDWSTSELPDKDWNPSQEPDNTEFDQKGTDNMVLVNIPGSGYIVKNANYRFC